MSIESYRDLQVWQKAMNLVESCYRISAQFPDTERYGLTSQLRRAAVSVPASIAEGHGRRATGEFCRYLMFSYGSLMELETHLQIAGRLNYLAAGTLDETLNMTAEVGRMLNGLRSSLNRRRA